jgi:hypothetical protein
LEVLAEVGDKWGAKGARRPKPGLWCCRAHSPPEELCSSAVACRSPAAEPPPVAPIADRPASTAYAAGGGAEGDLRTSSARILSPHEDGDETHPAGVLAAIEQRLIFCQPLVHEYKGDEDRWEEYNAKFKVWGASDSSPFSSSCSAQFSAIFSTSSRQLSCWGQDRASSPALPRRISFGSPAWPRPSRAASPPSSSRSTTWRSPGAPPLRPTSRARVRLLLC